MLTELESQLHTLQFALQNLALWEIESPSAEALASDQPFAIDTLAFPQWLQWIFIPKLRVMIIAAQPLPSACGMAAMGQEWGKTQKIKTEGLLQVLAAIDALLSN